ncbi:MAG: glycosyl hydrolase [Streptosporangiales bacterium]|nr:glycosyl hydrolase [Streptosporangiales bacterium]
MAEATEQRAFTLAFILADGRRCEPTWGNAHPLDDREILGEVAALRAAGGEVVVSSGGADGPYLENACDGAGALRSAYEQALDAVRSNHLDVDLEADVPMGRVGTALRGLQRSRGTSITLTLPVQDQRTGLTSSAMAVLHGAARHRLDVTVNAMVMNFGHTGDWGNAMTDAAEAVVGQLETVWPGKGAAEIRRMLGLTPMIGRNDSGMITTLRDARTLLAFARSERIGFLAFWSVARDNGSCRARRAVSTCSGVPQRDYAFTATFKRFAS